MNLRKQTYKVWNPEIETAKDALEIETTAPTFAGETYAEEVGILTSHHLMVQSEDGELYEVHVVCEPRPEFWGTAKRIN